MVVSGIFTCCPGSRSTSLPYRAFFWILSRAQRLCVNSQVKTLAFACGIEHHYANADQLITRHRMSGQKQYLSCDQCQKARMGCNRLEERRKTVPILYAEDSSALLVQKDHRNSVFYRLVIVCGSGVIAAATPN